MRVVMWFAVPVSYVIGFLVFLGFLTLWASAAWPHDIYMRVYDHNDPRKQLCCGGDEKTGDCEPLTADQIHETPAGVLLTSKRYGATVFVPRERVTWDLPRDAYAPGKPATDMVPYAGHWCGKPRAGTGWSMVTQDDPDPVFHTFCTFILPGGV